MKRNAILITAALFCLATSALAADEKQNAQPLPQPTEQSQMARTDAQGPMDQASSTKCECATKPQKHAKEKHQQSEPQNDPQAWQPEYGGGG
jgi:hypothetical protein